MSNAERLLTALAPVFSGTEAAVDEGVLDRLVAAVSSLADDEVTIAMVASADVEREFRGAPGLREAWKDWLEAYAELRFRFEDVREVGDNVLTIATQIGVTRHDGVEVEQPSAVVWRFRDGKLRRLEFHLDRRAAERSAKGD